MLIPGNKHQANCYILEKAAKSRNFGCKYMIWRSYHSVLGTGLNSYCQCVVDQAQGIMQSCLRTSLGSENRRRWRETDRTQPQGYGKTGNERRRLSIREPQQNGWVYLNVKGLPSEFCKKYWEKPFPKCFRSVFYAVMIGNMYQTGSLKF